MTAERLRSIRNVDPFVPFKIQMASGTSYPVLHRDYLSIHPTGEIATVYLPNGSASTLDIMLITELVEDRTPSAPRSNGA
ncbi:MAG TPA: hypothetical protein VKX17_06710 [Planctomycetota bacterium]|nr:hypothetical protein [Planctomycetota bacterium]